MPPIDQRQPREEGEQKQEDDDPLLEVERDRGQARAGLLRLGHDRERQDGELHAAHSHVLGRLILAGRDGDAVRVSRRRVGHRRSRRARRDAGIARIHLQGRAVIVHHAWAQGLLQCVRSAAAEHFVVLPAVRKIERKVRGRDLLAVRPRLQGVDSDEAGLARHEMMFERDGFDLLVDAGRRHVGRGLGFELGNLAAGPELGDARAVNSIAEPQGGGPGLAVERSGEMQLAVHGAGLGRQHDRLAGIEIG